MRFIRIYTPFICTIVTFIQALTLLTGVDEAWILVGSLASVFGNSMIIDLYFFSVSLRMCRWYKLNILSLFLTHVIGIVYDNGYIEDILYIYAVLCLTMFGIICFLIFRKFYEVK